MKGAQHSPLLLLLLDDGAGYSIVKSFLDLTHNLDCLQITGAYKSGNNNTGYNRSSARF